MRANAMMDRGEFAEAARLFDRLAIEARRRSMPVRAANLALRAAQAFLAQGEVEMAMDRLQRTVRVLARHGQGERVAQIVSRAGDELREKGYDAQAADLEQSAEDALSETKVSLEDLRASRLGRVAAVRGSLPVRCEGCGAPLVPQDVTWYDLETAECPYCGTIAKTVAKAT
jgi:tetratricopeptide (TPR) repeat protein